MADKDEKDLLAELAAALGVTKQEATDLAVKQAHDLYVKPVG